MSIVSFPDWKKIGKRVGKKLRDVINPPSEDGPSRGERRAQRLLDVFKGFAYFDDFEEVTAWRAADADPIQCANIPLMLRTSHPVAEGVAATSRILLCHDYNGANFNYFQPCNWWADAAARRLS